MQNQWATQLWRTKVFMMTALESIEDKEENSKEVLKYIINMKFYRAKNSWKAWEIVNERKVSIGIVDTRKYNALI